MQAIFAIEPSALILYWGWICRGGFPLFFSLAKGHGCGAIYLSYIQPTWNQSHGEFSLPKSNPSRISKAAWPLRWPQTKAKDLPGQTSLKPKPSKVLTGMLAPSAFLSQFTEEETQSAGGQGLLAFKREAFIQALSPSPRPITSALPPRQSFSSRASSNLLSLVFWHCRST